MANPQIYDTVFRDYFNEQSRLLSLCNALLGTSYDDPKDVQINTLEGAFFSNIKNDLSCLFHGHSLVMIGHQHTKNENLPLRFLIYSAELINRHLASFRKKLYQPALLPLPCPEFIAFYDGEKDEEERRTLHLSNAFGGDSHSMELNVQLYNINQGMNQKLKQKCLFLDHYSRFSNRLKANRRSGMSPNDAIQETLDYCKRNGIMADYLSCKTKEVFRMLNYAWNEEEAREALTEYGIEQGVQQGEEAATIRHLNSIMQKMHLTAEEAMDIFGISAENRSKYSKLL